MKKGKVWDILMWTGFGIVLLYFLLKALDILHSPALADVITILSAGAFIGVFVSKVDSVYTKLNKMSRVFGGVNRDIRVLREKCPVLKK